MKLWKVAALAFATMCLLDVLATCMVVFESHYNALLAGCFDVAQYLAGLVCSVLALDSILKSGWRNKRSLVIISAISAANFAGTILGVTVSRAL